MPQKKNYLFSLKPKTQGIEDAKPHIKEPISLDMSIIYSKFLIFPLNTPLFHS